MLARELQGALYDATIQLELNQVALTIDDVGVKVIAECGGPIGVESVELNRASATSCATC